MSPTARDGTLDRLSGKVRSHFAQQNGPLLLRVREGGKERPLELLVRGVAVLMEMLEAMAAGRGVTLIPENAERTTVRIKVPD